MGEDAVQAERSSLVSTHESQELLVPSSTPSLSQLGVVGAGASTEPGAQGDLATEGGISSTLHRDGVSPTGQVNAITVLTLLDKLVNMLDAVQENQHKMEQRHAEMESAVRGIQNDMTKLAKSHTSTSNTVSKLLEKSRKVSVHMKEVRERMDKQASQVRKLEANHAHLLRRNNFRVLIFQEENEIPSSVFVKDPVPFPRDEDENPAVDANRSQEEGLHTINLSSDEELGPDGDEEDDNLGVLDLTDDRIEKSRAEKIKRSSLKKVDSLKKAFSRQNIEKKMNKISTRIVPPEKRDKIKKSLTSNHPKNSSSKSSSFKISPLSFSMKKHREGDTDPETSVAPTEVSPSAVASIELAPISSPDKDVSFTELHPQLAPGTEELHPVLAPGMEELNPELALGTEELHPELAPGTEEPASSEAAVADLDVTEEVNQEYALSATLPQDASSLQPSCNGHEQEEVMEEAAEHKESPAVEATLEDTVVVE
ncbi:caveolae-associated protein 2b [Denticeps clupeoides]|uniref:Serum deprivation-response protein n=1 Tax=Denticeps clupeoides TaxID=299321 RepID=A0AAY4C1U2_9TELE|nr:caveolae-associated protein 2-like [Denticeps clupeoides]